MNVCEHCVCVLVTTLFFYSNSTICTAELDDDTLRDSRWIAQAPSPCVLWAGIVPFASVCHFRFTYKFFFSLRSRSSRLLYINYNIIVVRGMFIVWTQRQYPQILNVSPIVWNCVVRLLKGHRHRIVVWWWWTENEWRGMRKKRLQSIVTNA